MNERILELAEQAGFNLIQHGDHIIYDISTKDNMREFAELIVKECAKFVEETRWMFQPSQEQIARGIKEHFGVK